MMILLVLGQQVPQDTTEQAPYSHLGVFLEIYLLLITVKFKDPRKFKQLTSEKLLNLLVHAASPSFSNPSFSASETLHWTIAGPLFILFVWIF